MARQKFLSLATLVLTAGLGCQGVIGDATDSTGPGTGPGPGAGPMTGPMMGAGGTTGAGNRGGTVGPGGSGGGMNPPPADATAAGPMPLRRLTNREYNNTIRALLGDA